MDHIEQFESAIRGKNLRQALVLLNNLDKQALIETLLKTGFSLRKTQTKGDVYAHAQAALVKACKTGKTPKDARKPLGEDEYRVKWVIDLSATSPEEAARKALMFMQKPDTTATVFDVCSSTGIHVEVDLMTK